MDIPMFQVDAFTDRAFAGNPAAVCLLDHWLPDELMQSIARENNLSETAFVVPEGRRIGLRWFTPGAEVPLCGHATLATSHVLFTGPYQHHDQLVFGTKSGDLRVTRDDDRYAMDFPAVAVERAEPRDDVATALGVTPIEVFTNPNQILAVLESEESVRFAQPDLAAVARFERWGLCITARADDVDFVSRYFAPRVGVPEDPVTGSAHCMLAPYWAERLGKSTLHARQVGSRGGDVWCEVQGDRVVLSGHAVLVMEGTFRVPDPSS